MKRNHPRMREARARMRRPTLALALLAAAPACIPFGSVNETPGLEGLVLAADDGLPVSHAFVTAPDFDLEATTGEDGWFHIEPRSSRKLFVMLLPGSTMEEYVVQAWHGDGAIGEGYARVSSIVSSFGHSTAEVLLLLVDSDAPLHPAFETCRDALSFEASHAARLALRMEALMEMDAFRAAYTDDRAWRFEASLRHDLHEAGATCELDPDQLDALIDASYERQYRAGG